MGKPTYTGFKPRNVFPTSVHNADESRRKVHEAIIEAAKSDTKKEITENLVYELKPCITDIVKRAFMRYAQLHGADEALQKKEWQRFSGVLRRML